MTRNKTAMKWWWLGLVALVFGVSACGDEGAPVQQDAYGIDNGVLDEFGKPTLGSTGYEDPTGSKEDAARGRSGPLVAWDTTSTQVWPVTQKWTDTTSARAKAAGLAWGEDSGLNWDEKYVAWIGSLERTKGQSWGDTFRLRTPWGTEVDAPALECAETAMFLRITFASWYGLPWFMEGRDATGARLYFGHFGVRTEAGRYRNTPQYRDRYPDLTDKGADIEAGDLEWPSDAELAGRALVGSFDDGQPMIGPDAHLGAYLDRIFLNKRVGHFIMLQLLYFGSVNLADGANTFNIAPEAIRPGDVLLERWQRTGIGHTLVVMRRRDLGTQTVAGEELPLLEAELASGSMPRRQPQWESAASSKRTFTLEETGGGDYAKLGGGLKRWRSSTIADGRYRNDVLAADTAAFIPTWKLETLGARPERFDQLLTELGPQEKMAVLLEIIESKRQHLREHPASCSARISREQAFTDLYDIAADPQIGWDHDKVDREVRILDDYVFAELEYAKSRTCCWNSTTPAMYDLIMQHAAATIHDEDTNTCLPIPVFMATDDGADGFSVYKDFAAAAGRGAEWVGWRADETCPQAGVVEDTEAEHAWGDACEVLEF